MIIHTLGPAGTFSHEATEKLFPNGKIAFAPNFDALFTALEKNPRDIGIVPIENSLHGSVDEILDLLYESTVRIVRTHDLAIKHAFGARTDASITKISSHSQALRQCRKWLKAHYPNAEQVPTSSTAAAATIAASDASVGAIASANVLKANGLKIRSVDIEGDGNTTRFAVVSVNDPFKSEKRTHMTIVLSPKGDRPGLLHALLTPFKVYDVNLSRIESRPSGQRLGHYVFYLDFLGSPEDERTKKVLAELRLLAQIVVLGRW